MDHPRPRSRTLVTYGSSAKGQPHSKTTPAHTFSTKRTKGSLSRPHQPESSNMDLLGGRNERKGQPASNATTTPILPEPRATTDDSIYDLPSSDEEDKTSNLRRKRRRNGSNGNTAMRRNHLDSRDSEMIAPGSDSHYPSTTKSGAGNAQIANLSSRTRRNRDGGAQTTAKRISASPLANSPNRFRAAQESESSSDESETIKHAETSTRLPASPSFRKVTRTLAGNTTPNRRRLIDSLGTKECSIEGPSPKISIDGPLSSHFALCSPSQSKETRSPVTLAEGQREGFVQDSNVPHSPHLKGSKVTYARQRSFLDDLPLASNLVGSDNPSGLEQAEPLISPQRNPGNLVSTRSLAIEEVNDDDGTVRSIHELRQAGGNARYRGAVESIFEDIEDLHNSVSGRCNAFMQLCGKLLDSRLARQFVECGFDKRLVDCLSSDLDVVSTALAFGAFGLSFKGRSLPYLLATAAWPKLLDTSLILLDARDDMSALAQARSSNLSKPVQRSVRDICPKVTSALFDDVSLSQLSPCILALRCLLVTIAAFQEKGETPSGLPTPLLKQLVNLLLSEVPRNDGSTVLAPEQSLVLILGLSILEAHTSSGDDPQKEQLDILRSLPNMHGLLQWKNDPDAVSQQVQTLFIRVVLNVTNSNSSLCDDFGTGAMVGQLAEIALAKFDDLTEETLAQENNSLNTVILALGALINVTEQSDATRAMFLQPHFKTHSLLDRLLRLFSAHVDSTSKAHSVLEVHHNVAVGYLAVLLLAICLHTDVRAQVKRSMRSDGLSVVMSTVEEFLQYHRKIELELYPLQANGGPSGFIVRLQSLVSQIQRVELE